VVQNTDSPDQVAPHPLVAVSHYLGYLERRLARIREAQWRAEHPEIVERQARDQAALAKVYARQRKQSREPARYVHRPVRPIARPVVVDWPRPHSREVRRRRPARTVAVATTIVRGGDSGDRPRDDGGDEPPADSVDRQARDQQIERRLDNFDCVAEETDR
jgi:hypothetical protein